MKKDFAMVQALVPRRIFFDNPDRLMPKISPDGQKIAYIAPLNNVLNIWVAPLKDLGAARPVTHEDKQGLRQFKWAHTNAHILFPRDYQGDEDWHIHVVNLETGEIKDLTPGEAINARVEKISPKFPEEAILSLNDRRPDFHDLYRVNLLTGQKTKILENDDFVGFLIDQDLRVRFGMRMMPDGGSALEIYDQTSFKPFEYIPQEDTLTTSPLEFTKNQDQLYFLDSRGRDKTAFFIMTISTKEKKLLAESNRADVSGILLNPETKEFEGYCDNYLKNTWTIINPQIRADYDLLSNDLECEVDIVSRDLKDQTWIIAESRDDGPILYSLFKRLTKERTFLFASHQRLMGMSLHKMHPIVIPTRDGLEMVSYYTLPFESDPEQTGHVVHPCPLVLYVHGGPQARDEWGYSPIHQWLASRGYAVLSVNYRSSTGFGKSFINAGNGEWSRKMHDDLIDAVQWAIDQGIADKNKICISGASYGGYAALVGLTFTPDVFACGVDIVGPSNLITLFDSVPHYWKPLADMLKMRFGGDPDTEAGRQELLNRSPITKADQISKPLLIGQGANDPRVKQAESDQFVKVLQEKEIPVTYVLFPDEGHGFSRPQNRLAFFAIMEAFLAKHLGGRQEPFGNDLTESSHQLVTAGPEIASLMQTA